MMITKTAEDKVIFIVQGVIVAEYEASVYKSTSIGSYVPVTIFDSYESTRKGTTVEDFHKTLKQKVVNKLAKMAADLANYTFPLMIDSQVMSEHFELLETKLKEISIENICNVEQYANRFASVEASLANCETRDEAKHILEDELTTSVELKLFARRNDIVAFGTKAEVRDRIIESMVGSRLNSDAIQNYNKTARR